MDSVEIKRLRDLPIEGVAERLGLRVEHHKALCPFHNDHHASLSFDPRRNAFRCFVCDAHGNSIDLVMRHLRLDFGEACRWLAQGSSLMPPSPRPEAREAAAPVFDAGRYEGFFARPWLSAAAQDFLFGQRRIDPRVVRWCRLTSWRDRAGVDWLQTPYFSAQGRLIGVQHRRLSAAEGVPRFRFPKGSRCGIYNLPVLARLRGADELWITEGCSDCWAMLSAGRKAIAIPSATLLSKADRELLQALAAGRLPGGEEVGPVAFHMCPDQDAPGEILFMRLQEVLPSLVRHQLPKGCKDFADLYASQPKPLFNDSTTIAL